MGMKLRSDGYRLELTRHSDGYRLEFDMGGESWTYLKTDRGDRLIILWA